MVIEDQDGVLNLNLSEITDENLKTRRIATRILAVANLLHITVKRPATYVKVPCDILNKMKLGYMVQKGFFTDLEVIEDEDLNDIIIVGRTNGLHDDTIAEIKITF